MNLNMNIKRKIVTAVTSSALLLNTFATPAFAATIQISGNSAYTNNSANVDVNTTTTVVQNNSANITNNVDANANSGGNDASYNNGGDVSVTTGSANTSVNVTNAANVNSADIDCCPAAGNITVEVSNNSAFSDNDANLNLTNDQTVTQYNDANIRNYVDADATSGKNDASYNNGGAVEIRTGPATTNVTLDTLANLNSARIGGGSDGDGDGGNISLKIIGNSANSTNDIDAYLTNYQTLVQNNDAYVYNKVDADAKSGYNDANFNNGSGDVSITTGPATTKVAVDNLVNFNAADVDCGCILSDWEAKIANNGAFADSNITLDLISDATDVQYNDAYLKNKLEDLNADSGKNDANYNNSHNGNDDPAITTGPANTWVDVNNQSNVNTLGSVDLPDFPGIPDVGVDFSFSWGFLWTLLGLH